MHAGDWEASLHFKAFRLIKPLREAMEGPSHPERQVGGVTKGRMQHLMDAKQFQFWYFQGRKVHLAQCEECLEEELHPFYDDYDEDNGKVDVHPVLGESLKVNGAFSELVFFDVIFYSRPWLFDHDMENLTKPSTYSFYRGNKKYTLHPLKEEAKTEAGCSSLGSKFYAVVRTVHHCLHYLAYKEFILYSNHQAIKYLNSKKKLNDHRARLSAFLDEFNFSFNYKTGESNVVADALSRHSLVLTVMSNQIISFEELKNQYQGDPYFSQLDWTICSRKTATQVARRLFIQRQSIMHSRGVFTRAIIRQLHGSGLEHFGRDKTIAMVPDCYYWPKMLKDVDRLVKKCSACQLGKGNSQNKGLVHSFTWTRGSMDSFEQRRQIDGVLLEALWRIYGNKLRYSSTCHPQANGQPEATNRSLVKKTAKKTPLEAAYGLNPHELDLVPLPLEAHITDGGEAFVEHIRQLHEEVKDAMKGNNEAYATAASRHQ
ncbi:Uncharacterized protein TCM_017603 [Theobroma cacao]|uniref:Integrase zinc-binding domain-containing protein n=1 Tax=Theobroma cacao TaxID=3641 RepID=A0A061EDR6_THECC|nr:Uncharacterized protein TCM_017603 [Theobroma cacao]